MKARHIMISTFALCEDQSTGVRRICLYGAHRAFPLPVLSLPVCPDPLSIPTPCCCLPLHPSQHNVICKQGLARQDFEALPKILAEQMVEYYSLSKCTGGLVTVLGSVAVQTTLPLRYVMQCHSLLMLKGHQMSTLR